MKVCTICKEEKNLDSFHKLKTGINGRHSHCKECRSTYSKTIKYEKPIKGKLKCNKCHKVKDIFLFYRNRALSSGVQPNCIDCHKEKIYESQSKFDNYVNKLLTDINKIETEMELYKEDIIELYLKQEKKCKLSGELLTYYMGPNLTKNNYEKKFNITIDKIDNNKGYTKDNIRLIGKAIYKMKSHLSDNEFFHICQLICSNKI